MGRGGREVMHLEAEVAPRRIHPVGSVNHSPREPRVRTGRRGGDVRIPRRVHSDEMAVGKVGQLLCVLGAQCRRRRDPVELHATEGGRGSSTREELHAIQGRAACNRGWQGLVYTGGAACNPRSSCMQSKDGRGLVYTGGGRVGLW